MERLQCATTTLAGQDYTALVEDVLALEDHLRPEVEGNHPTLVERLERTHFRVLNLLRFEEEVGCLDDVRANEPRLERAIQHLTAERWQLTQSLEALIRDTRTARPVAPPLRVQVRNWIERLRHYLARENQLVQEAITLDIGAED